MRLLQATLAAALLAFLASTPAAAVGSLSPELFRLEPVMKVERVSSFGLASGGGLVATLAESCGAAPNDGVIVTAQACSITIAVTDTDGTPVSGAALVSTRLPSDAITDVNGMFTHVVNIAFPAVIYVDVSHDGRTGQVHFYAVSPGRGLLFVELKDRHGGDVTDWSTAVGVDNWATAWLENGGHGLNLIAGTARMAVTADLGNGEGYVLHADGIQIPVGGRATVTLDGQNSHPIQTSVEVDMNGSPQVVTGAAIFATRDEASPLYLRSGVRSNASGDATIHVSPGIYDVAALGGNPGIFVEAQGVVVTDQAANLALAVGSDLSLVWSFNPPTTPTEQKLIVTGALGGQHPLIQADPATLHMAPGSYQLVTDMTYDLEDQLWIYRLHHNPGGATFTYGFRSYQSGIAYNFSDTGPWVVAIGGPARIESGDTGTYPISLSGANAIVEWIDGYLWEEDPLEHVQPSVTITSAVGDALQTTMGWQPTFSSNLEGIYYVDATVSVPGPFFAFGLSFSGSRKIGIGVDPDLVLIQVVDPDGDQFDRVMVADGQPKLVQITVQMDGGPVIEAEIHHGDQYLGSTDANGQVQVNHSSEVNQVVSLRVTSQSFGIDTGVDLMLAQPGWAWVDVSLRGVDGLLVQGLQVYDQKTDGQFSSDGEIASGFVQAADPDLVVVASPTAGLGYYYRVNPTLQPGQRNQLVVDAQANQSNEIRRQVLADTPSGLATGAQAHLQGVPVTLTDSNGRVKLYLSGEGPYELAITSAPLRLLAIKSGVSSSLIWDDVDLRNQATGSIAFQASSPTGESLPALMVANLWGSSFSYPVGDPGVYRVTGGAYSLKANLELSDTAGDLWTYHFMPQSPGLTGAAGLLIEPGMAARFDIGGPLAPVLTTGLVNNQPTATFKMLNASNSLYAITKQGSLITPDITWDKIGTLDEIHATLAQTGPLFGAQTFAARVVLNLLPSGNNLWLERVPTVGPGGEFRVQADSTVSGVTAATLEILFDPSELDLDLAQSGGSSITAEPGRAIWTSDGPGLLLDLAFMAVSGFHGESLIRLGPGSTISTSDGPVSVNLGDSLITVAKNTITVKVVGSTQPTVAMATTVDSNQAGRFDQNSSLHSFYNLPQGTVQILGRASGFLSSSNILPVPEFGSSVSPDLNLRWGDLNGDNQVDSDDLDLIADRMTGKVTAFADQVDSDGQGVNILDLIRAARNLGEQGDPPLSYGTLDLLLTTPALTGQSLWIQATPMGSAAAAASVLIDLGNSSQTREAAALLNLPTGSYEVNVQIKDGPALHTMIFTVYLMHGQVTKVYLSYE